MSPTEPVVTGGGPAISNASVPIATSTPVNVSTGPISPPPLTSNTESTIKASYPAVLKGRSAASPPNPNMVPSGKVPPPVPPRGSGRGRTDELRGTIASPSSTSGRGEGTSVLLHETTKTLHHSDSKGPLHATIQSQKTSLPIVKDQWANYNDSRFSFYDNVHLSQFQMQKSSQPQNFRKFTTEEDEFVSVEKVDNFYYLRSSPCPFRPARRNYKNDKDSSMNPLHQELKKWVNDEQPQQSKLQKFTNFINPSQNLDLGHFKLSRKDKKLSETYYEKIRRKEKENENKMEVTGKMLKVREKYFIATEKYPKATEKYPKAAEKSKVTDKEQKVREKDLKVKGKKFKAREKKIENKKYNSDNSSDTSGIDSHPQQGESSRRNWNVSLRRQSLLKQKILGKRLKKKKLAPIPSSGEISASSSSVSLKNSRFIPKERKRSGTATSEREKIEIQFGNRIGRHRPVFKICDNNALKFRENGENENYSFERESDQNPCKGKLMDSRKLETINRQRRNVNVELDSMRLPNFSFLHGQTNTRIYKF